MFKKILLASNNQKKLAEIKPLLAELDCELIRQKDLGIADAVEDGLSFVENAIKKARHACQHSGLPAIADDSGIEVDYLNGRPGIYSARFAGEHASDEDNLQKLLTEMHGVPEAQRTARYQCVIVFMQHAADPTPLIAQAHWQGRLLETKQGTGGFGYDPIFYVPERGCSAAELSAEQKAALSHRGKALRQFKSLFMQRFGGARDA